MPVGITILREITVPAKRVPAIMFFVFIKVLLKKFGLPGFLLRDDVHPFFLLVFVFQVFIFVRLNAYLG